MAGMKRMFSNSICALTGDFYKKIVIRDDIPHHFYDDKGFLHCSLLDFLMDRIELF